MEAEWEFAASGGNQTTGYTYSGGNDLNTVGWYQDNSGSAACNLSEGRGTWPVGQKAANELGLYDMSGNVWEWCWDRIGPNRRLCGGAWSTYASVCAVSYRNNLHPDLRNRTIGFRLARSSGVDAMVLVEGGTLAMSMGTRTVDTFYIGRYEVTWGEWQAVRAEAADRGYDVASFGVGAGCADDHPVRTSWGSMT